MTKLCYLYSRVSTDEQTRKTGLARQQEKAKAWIAKHGYALADELIDDGVSAYKGANSQHGELGAFIAAVEAGVVQKGSVLIVESFDRISREKPRKALLKFIALLEAGVEVVTMADTRHYTLDSVDNDFTQLLLSLLLMARANEESETKSMRVLSAKNKRKSEKKPYGGKPFWLDNVDGKYVFNKHAPLVKQIFDLALDGLTANEIAKYFVSEGVKRPILRKNHQNVDWHPVGISQILKQKQAMGVLVGRNATEEVHDYYPAIVDSKTFMTVRTIVEKRSSGRSNTGTMRNLFSGIAYCNCGKGMTIRTASKSRINERTIKASAYKYICSSESKRQPCGFKSRFSYPLEKAVLSVLPKLDMTKAKGKDNRPKIQSEIDALEAQRQKIAELVRTADAPETFVDVLMKIESDLKEKRQELIQAELESNAPESAVQYDESEIDSILDKNNIELRRQVHANLLLMIKSITISENLIYIRLNNDKLYFIKTTSRNDYKNMQVQEVTKEAYLKHLSEFAY
ncbi:TPA: recombinase family protein [Vibrio vulnificus]|nr:recombinase family protein [Vibrio vulnificus]